MTDVRVEEAMERFVAAVPGAEAVLAEHLADNDEMLPHLLMADLRRFFVAAVSAGDTHRVEAFVRGLEDLSASPHEGINNVVGVSFFEDIVQGADDHELKAIDTMRPLLGPAARRELANTESFVNGTPDSERPSR